MGVKLEVMRVTTAECDDVSKRSSSRVLLACGDIKGETVSCRFHSFFLVFVYDIYQIKSLCAWPVPLHISPHIHHHTSPNQRDF